MFTLIFELATFFLILLISLGVVIQQTVNIVQDDNCDKHKAFIILLVAVYSVAFFAVQLFKTYQLL